MPLFCPICNENFDTVLTLWKHYYISHEKWKRLSTRNIGSIISATSVSFEANVNLNLVKQADGSRYYYRFFFRRSEYSAVDANLVGLRWVCRTRGCDGEVITKLSTNEVRVVVKICNRELHPFVFDYFPTGANPCIRAAVCRLCPFIYFGAEHVTNPATGEPQSITKEITQCADTHLVYYKEFDDGTHYLGATVDLKKRGRLETETPGKIYIVDKATNSFELAMQEATWHMKLSSGATTISRNSTYEGHMISRAVVIYANHRRISTFLAYLQVNENDDEQKPKVRQSVLAEWMFWYPLTAKDLDMSKIEVIQA